jgi:hypothetical protein
MRCPPSLVFDDSYQRCEWPGTGAQTPRHRLSSLRNRKDGKKQIQQPQNSTVSTLNTVVQN